MLAAYRLVRGGPESLRDPIGVELIGVRRTPIGAQALVRADEAALLDGDVLIEPPTLEDIAVHIGSPSRTRTGAAA